MPRAGREIDRPEMIEEHERADLPAQAERQHAPHDEAVAKVMQARLDDEFRLAEHHGVPVGWRP